MPNQNTSFACQYDPNNDQLNILLSNNLENQNENDRKILVDAVGYIIGVMNNFINEIIPDGNGSEVFKFSRSFILEFGFDYAVNLRQAREQYGEQGYRDELTAIARSSASFIVGFAGSEAGKLAGAFISNTPAGRIGGAVIAGVAASVVYDYYLSSSVDAFFDGIIGSPIRNVNQTNPSNNLISVQTQLENGTFQSKAFNIKNATINNYPSLNYQDIFYDIEDDTNHNVITTYLSIEGGRNLIIGYDNPNNSYNDGFSSGFRSIISYAASQESIHADLLSNTITTGTELAQDGALANQDILVNINNVYGGYGDDFMLGNLHSNELRDICLENASI